jgi:hypothetical protein
MLLNFIPLTPHGPLRQAKIDDINACHFVAPDLIAYSMGNGGLTICRVNDFKPISSKTYGGIIPWVVGSGNGTLVVQSPHRLLGFSSATLAKQFEIQSGQDVLLATVSQKRQQIAAYDSSGAVAIYSISNVKRPKTISTSKPAYAQAWMRLEFTAQGDALYFFLHSLRNPADTVTKVIDVGSGKVIYQINDWHKKCAAPVRDAVMLPQDETQLLLATQSKGVFLANVRSREVKQLFVPRGSVYGIESAQIGKRRLAFVCSEDWTLQVYDVDTALLCEVFALPKGYVRSFAISQNQSKLALVVNGEDGDNLVVADTAGFMK